MQNENEEFDTQTEEVETTEETVAEPKEEEVKEEEGSDESNELKTALIQKKKFREKLEATEAKLAEALKRKADPTSPLDVEDYIDISASLDGLDQREKSYLAEQHKLSGKPLKEIRESEDFQLWNEAYRARQEKEAALKPNSTQELEDAPQTLTSALRGKSIEEKEAILRAQGLYKDKRNKADKTDIGQKRSIG